MSFVKESRQLRYWMRGGQEYATASAEWHPNSCRYDIGFHVVVVDDQSIIHRDSWPQVLPKLLDTIGKAKSRRYRADFIAQAIWQLAYCTNCAEVEEQQDCYR